MHRLLPIIDHGSLAAGSFLITVLAARDLSVSEFAGFAAVQLVIFLVVGAFRAGPGGWIVVAEPEASLRQLGAGLAGVGLALGVTAGLAVAGVSVVMGLSPWSACWATVYLTGLLVMDALRFRCYRGREVGAAGLLSASALIAVVGASALVGPSGAVDIFAVAAASYGVVAVAAWTALVRPRLMRTGLQLVLRCGQEAGKGTLAGYFGLSAFRLGAPVAMSLTGGPIMLASFRGAQTLASLPLQLPESLRLPYLVRAARLQHEQGHLPPSFVRVWPLMLIAVLGPCLVAALLVPDAAGEAVLGETWGVAGAALPLVILGAFFNQLTVGLELVARVTGGVQHIARVRIWAGSLGLPVVALAARYGLLVAMSAYALICMITWLLAKAGVTFQSRTREAQ